MASFDIVSRIELQEVDNAVNITKKAILSRYDFRESKTEIALDKKASHDIDYVIDRIVLTQENKERLIEAVKKGLDLGKGSARAQL